MGARSSNAKIWGWAVTQGKCFKWFNYSRTRAHPGCKVSCHGTESTCIIGSSMLHWGQSDSGEGCIMLQSRLTYSLVAKFPQHQLSFQIVPSFQFQLVSTLLGRTDWQSFLVLGLGQQLRIEIVGVDYYLMLLPCQVVFDALMLSLISTTLRQCPESLCMGTPFYPGTIFQ